MCLMGYRHHVVGESEMKEVQQSGGETASLVGTLYGTGTCSKIAIIVIVLVCVPESEHKQQGTTL